MKKFITVLLLVALIATCALCVAACDNEKDNDNVGVESTYKFVSFATATTVYGNTYTFPYLKGDMFNKYTLKADSMVVVLNEKELKGSVSVDEAFYGSKTYNFTYVVENENKLSAQVDGIGKMTVHLENDFMIFNTSVVTGESAVFYLQRE